MRGRNPPKTPTNRQTQTTEGHAGRGRATVYLYTHSRSIPGVNPPLLNERASIQGTGTAQRLEPRAEAVIEEASILLASYLHDTS